MFPRWPTRRVVRLGILLLIVLFMGRDLSGAVSMVSDYVIHVWRAENGLPQNSVTSVLQTRDGYIWIGTYNALARFDGVRFTMYDSSNTHEMRSSRVTGLFEGRDGTLWIGHEDGGVTLYRNGRFEHVKFQSPWDDKGVFHIGEDDAGDIWLASRDCLFTRLRDGRTCKPPVESARGWASVSTSPGGVWAAGNGVVSAIRHGEMAPLQLGPQSQLSSIRGICPGREGGFWVLNDGKLREWDGRTCMKDFGTMPWGLTRLTTMIETRAGMVAAGTHDEGLYLISGLGQALHFSRTNGLPSDWITSIAEDCEGNLWVGTRAGLVMLHASGITTVAPPDKCEGCPVLSVAVGAKGEIWAATEGAGIYCLTNGQWLHYGKEDGLLNTYVWSVSPDASGRLWAGTWGEGVFVQKDDSFGHATNLYFRLPALALIHEADGTTWIGTSMGLVCYAAGQVDWVVRKEQMQSPDVRCIMRDGKGTLWFGMFGGGLGRLKDGKLQQFRKSDGLPSDFVQCLRGETNGSLWIGTFNGGLARLKDDRFVAIGPRQGFPGNDIGDIETDDHGFFWISSSKGILRVSQAELNGYADGLTREIHYRFFDADDGVPTVECSGGLQPAGGKTADGRLVFPSSEGLVMIDPGCVRTNLLPPPVYIEKVLVDDHTAEKYPANSPLLRIPPGQHQVEIRYTALNYSAPDRVCFKYRLDGMDKGWVSAGMRRMVHYSYLPPGRYNFHVIACNDDGVWSKAGAQTSFAVLPYYWQTLWFRILAGATALSAVGGIVWVEDRRRLRRKLERIEQQRAVEQERARIAHDIHDDLGTYLTRITMLSDSARGGSGNGSQAAASLQYIHETATELTAAMAETVWAVNPHHDTLDSLINYLQKFAQEFLEHAGIRCRLDVPFQLPAWFLSAETRHNLFLAFKETLNNIVKHADATEVHIGLTLEPAGFVLVIGDDGCGVADGCSSDAVANPPAGFNGNGLKNIKRRIEKIGGRCEIRTVSQRGTSVEFKVPVKPIPAELTGGRRGI